MQSKEMNELFAKVLPIVGSDQIDINAYREFIKIINDFFFTTYDNIGKIGNSDVNYFSEWHKVWDQNYREFLVPSVDLNVATELANALNLVNVKYPQVFCEMYDTHNLSGADICKIRFFTSNQDFADSIDFAKMRSLYLADISLFDKHKILESPGSFLHNIGVLKLSQGDKRMDFAKSAALLLINKNIEAFDIYEYCNHDCIQIRSFLINGNIGYQNKKADMFIRDMIVLGVWKNPINFDSIDVAADVNTMKVALRSGLVKTEMPLLTSFLDIYSPQYGAIVEQSVLGWRTVWEIWKDKYPETCLKSPCLMDYLIYRIIGREFCKDKMVTYKGKACGHVFIGKPGIIKCKVCSMEKEINKLDVIERKMTCEVENDVALFRDLKFVSNKNDVLFGLCSCPFKGVCKPYLYSFVKYDTPKSISIYGQTGWINSYSILGKGGGGMMG